MTATTTQVRERFRIRGRVQGVGYRYNMRLQAQALALTGWCRNLPDGDVEAEVFGASESLEALAHWCRQGPTHAKVTDVVREPLSDDTPIPATFEVRP